MHKLGTIIRLQVQCDSLKQGQAGTHCYDPTPIVSVPAQRIERNGVIGLAPGGEIRDIHHAAHAASKFRAGNGISVNVASM